jgi:hypothetical protein
MRTQKSQLRKTFGQRVAVAYGQEQIFTVPQAAVTHISAMSRFWIMGEAISNSRYSRSLAALTRIIAVF